MKSKKSVPASQAPEAVVTSPVENTALKAGVRNIFEVQNGYARVSVKNDVFDALRGMNPSLPYTTSRNAQGQGIRIFDVGGVTIMTRYDKESKKTFFIMKEADAKAHLQTLAEERAGEPVLAFSL